MESLLLVSDTDDLTQRTFYRDEQLPSLPLPKLEDTLHKYLESCQPVVDSDEYERTVGVVKDFLENDGKRLHGQLEKRSKEQRNWLHDWWLDAYLTFRGPASMLNFSGINDYSYWPVNDQLKSAALQFHYYMKFWEIIREEKLKQQTDLKGNAFNMSQFRGIFNTCRIPQLQKDALRFSFKTKYEGDCPSHIIFFYKKRMYKIDGISPQTGRILTPSQFHRVLLEVVKNNEEGVGVAFLSELKRDEWATARSHLHNLSLQNQKALNTIETAVFCASIPDNDTKDYDDILRLGMFDSAGIRWMDKTNVMCAKSNKFVLNLDHTPCDGMVGVTMMLVIDIYLNVVKNIGLDAIWGDDSAPITAPVELKFHIDNEIKTAIAKGRSVVKEVGDGSEVRYFKFTEFGKDGIKKLGKIHPCAFIQAALQYAYMKMEGEPASTYETATTRTFYKGRTETIRTCTSENVAFCRAMLSDSASESNKKQLFLKACHKYYEMYEECKLGRGCDRHLLGLAMTAIENGEELPALFTDPAFVKSGGGGNFILSTSSAGYGTVAGVCLPFRDDGFGAFYRIDNQSILFLITTLKSGSYTSVINFEKHLNEALIDCYRLMDKSSL